MKRLSILIAFFVCVPSFAAGLKLTSYDGGWYSIMDPAYAYAGQLTSTSDYYYDFYPFEKMLTLSITEYLGDGNGGEYPAPYDSVCNYAGITFDNMFDMLEFGDDALRATVADLKSQFNDYTLSEFGLTYEQFESILGSWDNISEYEDYIAEFFSSQNLTQDVLALKYTLRNIATQTQTITFNRMKNSTGRNGGDVIANRPSVWAQSVYSHAKKTGYNDFVSDGYGIALGGDGYIIDKLLLGAGYSYNMGQVNSTVSDGDLEIHNLFAYGQYSLNDFYINAIAGYMSSDYKFVGGEKELEGSTLYANLNVGYNTDILSPEFGLRYANTSFDIRDKYINSIDDSSVMTVVSGLYYEYGLAERGFSISAHGHMTYDVVNSADDLSLSVGHIHIHNEYEDDVAPLGVELGAGLQFDVGNAVLGIRYELAKRSDFTAHMGVFNLKYKF